MCGEASAYPRDFPQVLYSTLQKNDPARRHEHYLHVYTCDVTCELYCTYKMCVVHMHVYDAHVHQYFYKVA